MKIYEYIIRIKDQGTDKLRRVMSASQGAMGGMRNLGKSFSAAGSEIMGLMGLSGGLAAVLGPAVLGGAILWLGHTALDLAADLEQVTVGFEVMLGSAEKAHNMISDIRNMAKFTPFETMDLVKSSEILLGFGIAGEDVMGTMMMLGDVARGNADKLRLISLAYAQIQAAGRLMGQDLLQLVNAGFNPLQEISVKTGRSMRELKKEMEKGNISAAMVTDAFRSATAEGGRFFGMMDKQSKTYLGQLSTLKDEWKEMLIEIGQKLIPVAIKALQGLRGALNDLTTRVDFSPIKSVFVDLSNALSEVWGLFKQLFSALGFNIEQADIFQLIINNLAGTFRVLLTPLRLAINTFMLMFDVVKNGIDVVKGLGLMLHGLATRDFTTFKMGFDIAGDGFSQGFDDVKKRVTDFFKTEYEGYKQIFTTGAKPGEGMAQKKQFALPGSGDPGSEMNKLKDGINKITGGGKQSVNVTINLENLVGTQNFDVKNIKETVRDMEQIMIDAMLRVVNSANYAAAQ